jgi:formimidoylglutamate deiminase
MASVVEAALTWTGARFEPGIRIAIDRTGRIEAVGGAELAPTVRLPRVALVPGLVDAHSHAFQRGMRGHGEGSVNGAENFWRWREAMYRLVESLNPAAFRGLCTRAFSEMRDAGITTVGEFHYLHHAPGTEDSSFDRLLLEAASEVGIRLVVLQSYYRTGGIQEPLQPAQRRFHVESTVEYWDRFDQLAERLDPATQTLGVAPHSIRAASLEEIASLHAESARRGLPFHMHVEEQRTEIEDSVLAFGEPPMALLLRALPSMKEVVAVHCTHTRPEDLSAFIGAGGAVCLCPLTEANLGDGLPDLAPITGVIDRLCLGTDSNARIAMTEEMRWLEYGQRLRQERRGVFSDETGSVARPLLSIATVSGARALGVEAGTIEVGYWADLTALDLDAPALADCDPDTLLDAWVFGGDNQTIAATCVGGRWRESSGRPAMTGLACGPR